MDHLPWEDHKVLIRRLYLAQDLSLDAIVKEMSTRGFHMTKNQLQYKLNEWNFRKRLKPDAWIYVNHQVEKRKREGKDSDVIVSGVRLPPEKVKKEIHRQGHMSTIERLRQSGSPPPPQELPLSICTPSTSSMEFSWNPNMPWIRFQERHLDDTRFPQLATNNGGQDSVALIHISALLPEAAQNINRVAEKLANIMPEAYDGEHLMTAEILCNGCPDDKSTELFKVTLYQLSNKLPAFGTSSNQNSQDQAIVELFRNINRANPNWTVSLAKSVEPTAESLKEVLFAAAVRQQAADIAKDSLDMGVDPNLVIFGKTSYKVPKMLTEIIYELPIRRRALQVALHLQDLEIAQLLLDAGANPSWILNLDPPSSRGSLIDLYPLEIAAASVNKEMGMQLVQLLISRGVSLTHQVISPIVAAVTANNTDAVRLLIERGIEIPKAGITQKQIDPARGQRSKSVSVLGLALQLKNESLFKLLFDTNHYRENLHQLPDCIDILTDAIDQKCSWIFHNFLPIVRFSFHTAQTLRFVTLTYPQCRRPGVSLAAETLRVLISAVAMSTIRNDVESVSQLLRSQGYGPGFVHDAGVDFYGVPRFVHLLVELDPARDYPNPRLNWCVSHLMLALLLGNTVISDLLMDHGFYLWPREQSFACQLSLFFPELCHQLRRAWATPAVTEPEDFDALLREFLGSNYEHEGLIQARDGRAAKAKPGALRGRPGKPPAYRSYDFLPPESLEPYTGLSKAVYTACITQDNSECETFLSCTASLDYHLTQGPRSPAAQLLVAALSTAAFYNNNSLLARLIELFPSRRASDELFDCSLYLSEGTAPPAGYWELKHPFLVLSTRRHTFCSISPFYFAVLGRNAAALPYLADIGWVLCEKASELIPRCGMALELYHSLPEPARQVVWRSVVARLAADLKSVHTPEFDSILMKPEVDVDFSICPTPLVIAVCKGNTVMTELLLKAGANVNAPLGAISGATALQWAALKGQVGLARMLIEAGADVNGRGARQGGRTALQAAGEFGRIDMIQLLLNSGISVSPEGRWDCVEAIRYAKLNGHLAASKLIQRYVEFLDESLLQDATDSS